MVLFLCCPLSVQAATMRSADYRAYNAPSSFNNDLPGLVKYLIQPYKENEKMKARVIFAWIAYNIKYDQYEANYSYEARNNIGNASPLKTFKRRSGVCRDFASLYKYMANMAGLECTIISGMVKEGPHAWNAVRIDEKWELLDVTWAARNSDTFRNIKNDRDYERAVLKRQLSQSKNRNKNGKWIDDKWFMTPPKRMIKTHVPANQRWALLSSDYQYKKGLKKLPKKMEFAMIDSSQPITAKNLKNKHFTKRNKIATEDVLKQMKEQEERKEKYFTLKNSTIDTPESQTPAKKIITITKKIKAPHWMNEKNLTQNAKELKNMLEKIIREESL